VIPSHSCYWIIDGKTQSKLKWSPWDRKVGELIPSTENKHVQMKQTQRFYILNEPIWTTKYIQPVQKILIYPRLESPKWSETLVYSGPTRSNPTPCTPLACSREKNKIFLRNHVKLHLWARKFGPKENWYPVRPQPWGSGLPICKKRTPWLVVRPGDPASATQKPTSPA